MTNKIEKKKPKTAIGYLLNNLDSLEPAPDAEGTITTGTVTPKSKAILNSSAELYLDPSEIVPWKYANRDSLDLGDIDSLAESIIDTGQLEPILVRPLKSPKSGGPKYEFIFGCRRWTACKKAGIKVKAVIQETSDRIALKQQKIENEERKSLSAYSEGLHYKKLLDDNEFSSQQDLSDYLGVDRRRLSDLLSYSRIPNEISKEIPNINELPTSIATKVAAYSAKGSKYIEALVKIAPKLGGKVSKRKLDTEIDEFINGKKIKTANAIKVKSRYGAEIFSVRQDSNGSPCITLHRATREVINQEELIEKLKDYIDSLLEDTQN